MTRFNFFPLARFRNKVRVRLLDEMRRNKSSQTLGESIDG